MNSRLIISLLIAGALAFACGPRAHSSGASADSVARLHTRRDSSVAARFGVRQEEGAYRFALDVTNVGPKRVEITFPSGQAYDFVVVDSVGREVWRWADGRMFTQTLQNKTLSGGDTMRIAEAWEPAGLHGHYTAIARLRSTNYPVEQRVSFVIQ